jgi:hypothetical protein
MVILWTLDKTVDWQTTKDYKHPKEKKDKKE